MVLTKTYGIDKDLWYGQGLMVLTTPMVLTKTHGIESVLLNHTRTRGPSVTRMRDFFWKASLIVQGQSSAPEWGHWQVPREDWQMREAKGGYFTGQ